MQTQVGSKFLHKEAVGWVLSVDPDGNVLIPTKTRNHLIPDFFIESKDEDHPRDLYDPGYEAAKQKKIWFQGWDDTECSHPYNQRRPYSHSHST